MNKVLKEKGFIVMNGYVVKPNSNLARILRNRVENENNEAETIRIKQMEKERLNSSKYETMEEKAQNKIVQILAKERADEIVVARQVSIMVRKEAMRQYLKSEEDKYTRELNERGWTLYQERI